MISYSQNGEDLIIAKYFGDYVGNLLSLGENDGQTLSNVFGLIKDGWNATLVEASPAAFLKLRELHKSNLRVHYLNVAVGNVNAEVEFQDSGSHLQNGDVALLSTASKPDYNKWKNSTEYNLIKVQMVTFDKLLEESHYKTFDLVSMDIEGFDLVVLRQMNLEELGVKVLCIEFNGDKEALKEIRSICSSYGLNKELLINGENVILAK